MTRNTSNTNANQLIPNSGGNFKVPFLTQLPDSSASTTTTPKNTLSAPTTSSISTSIRTHTAKNVPAFLNKLHSMVGDSTTDELIHWSEDGTSFVVTKHEEFAKEVLPRFFKHNNFSSFVRQLNMYGFHKIPHLQQGVLQADEGAEHWEFSNPYFLRNQPDLLYLVTRKRGREAEEKEGGGLDLNNIMSEIISIRKHQLAISADLKNLQRENEQLWQETLSSRERYNKQQETIDKILRFLASVFSSNKKNKEIVPRKRKLLLENADITSRTNDCPLKYQVTQDLSLDFDPTAVDLSSIIHGSGPDTSIFASTQPSIPLYSTLSNYAELFKDVTPTNTRLKSDRPSADFHATKPPLSKSVNDSTSIAQTVTPQMLNILPSTKPALTNITSDSLVHSTPGDRTNGTSKSIESITSEMDQLNQNIESLASSLGIDPLIVNDPIFNLSDVDMDELLNNYSDIFNHQVNHEQLLSLMAPSTDEDSQGTTSNLTF